MAEPTAIKWNRVENTFSWANVREWNQPENVNSPTLKVSIPQIKLNEILQVQGAPNTFFKYNLALLRSVLGILVGFRRGQQWEDGGGNKRVMNRN